MSLGTGTAAVALREQWLERGREIVAGRDAASWEFADWLASAEAPREMTDSAIAEAVGVSRRKIGVYREVSSTYPSGSRLPPLSFSHHLEARRLPDEERARVLGRAAEDGWSRETLRAEVREASLKGKLARQAAEIRALKRALAAARTDPRDTVALVKSRLAAEAKVCRQAAARGAAQVDETLTGELLPALHGNTRRVLARDLRRLADKLAQGVNMSLDLIESVAARIEEF